MEHTHTHTHTLLPVRYMLRTSICRILQGGVGIIHTPPCKIHTVYILLCRVLQGGPSGIGIELKAALYAEFTPLLAADASKGLLAIPHRGPRMVGERTTGGKQAFPLYSDRHPFLTDTHYVICRIF